MSLLPRRSAHIPGGSRSLFAVLSFLLLLTLPQHLAEGESKVPAGHTVPDTPRRLVTGPQELAKGSASTSYNPVSSAGGPSAVLTATSELRCVCLTITSRVNPKMIANMEVIAAGPQCPRVEVM